MDSTNLEILQNNLGYTFSDLTLLITALTHSSYANEFRKDGAISNERLEFLGDSVLGMTVSSILYSDKENLPEGKMTRLRSELVCERSLAHLAAAIDLGTFIRLGNGEDLGGGRTRPSILADAAEAVLAAMYLDGGLEPVRNFIKTNLVFESALPIEKNTDYKTALQEIIQVKKDQLISYHVIEETGPDHEKHFVVEVRNNNLTIGIGEGKSKKMAEQAAAKTAITRIK